MPVTHEEHGPEQPQARPLPDLKSWRIPQFAFLVECAFPVLEQIRLEVEAAHNLAADGRETGGVLFGTAEDGRIRILAAQPLECEHAFGPGFVLSENDEERLSQTIAAPAGGSTPRGLQALGWYHSHLRSGILLSERDQQIHSRYFGAPHQVALVVQPRSAGAARAGIFFQDASGVLRTDASYHEFTIEAPAPEIKPADAQRKDGSHGRTSPQPKDPQSVEAVCPKCGSKQVQRSRRTGPVERLRAVFGSFPYRCDECLSRSFLNTSSPLLERGRASRRKRPEERKRARQRTRREMLLWGGGILFFLALLRYLIRDTGPKQDAQ